VILLEDCGRVASGTGLKETITNKSKPSIIPQNAPAMKFIFFIFLKIYLLMDTLIKLRDLVIIRKYIAE
jgi:hypothetical protein